MGLTFKKDNSLEKMFEDFAIDPDKKEIPVVEQKKENVKENKEEEDKDKKKI